MTDGVEDADGGHCASDNSQYLPDQFIDSRLVLAVGDIDGLNFGHEHGLLGGFVAVGPSRSDGVPVVLAVLLVIALDDHWDDLEVVEEVQLLSLRLEVLHHLPCVEVALQLVDVVLDVLALVRNGEVESVVAETKAERVQSIVEPCLKYEVRLDLPDQVALSACSYQESAWRLILMMLTLGSGMMPVALHLLSSTRCRFRFSFQASRLLLRLYQMPVNCPTSTWYNVTLLSRLCCTYYSSSLNSIANALSLSNVPSQGIWQKRMSIFMGRKSAQSFLTDRKVKYFS